MCGIFRLTTVYSSMAGHGGIWLVLCVYRYANATMGHTCVRYTIYDIQTQYTTAIARASQRPGACIACACVRYIIILL